MKKLKIFIQNFLILTFTSLLLNILGLSFNTYITNLVGTECLGIFSLVMSVFTFAVTLANSGLYLATTRIVSEELACHNEYLAKKAAKKCLFYSFIVGTLSCLLVVLFSNMIASIWLHGKVNSLTICILGLSLPFVAISGSITGYFNAIRKASKNAVAQILEQITKIVFSTFLILNIMPKGIDYSCLALVIGILVSEVLSFIYIFICYQKDISKRKCTYKEDSKENISKRILDICVPVAIASYIRSGLSTLKNILIPLRLEKSGMSCELAVSSYGMINGIALPLILFPSVFINSFSSLLIPEFARYYATKDSKKINYIISKIFKTSCVFSISMFFIFYYFSKDLCNLLYPNIEIVTYVKLLSPLLLIIYLDTIVDSILKGLNEQLSVMKCNILDLFVSISFIYFLLPMFGTYGYIVVIYISEILNGLISIKKLLSLTKVKFQFLKWLILPILSGLLALQSIYLMHIQMSNMILNLAINMLLFLLIYLFFLFLMSGIDKKDFKL